MNEKFIIKDGSIQVNEGPNEWRTICPEIQIPMTGIDALGNKIYEVRFSNPQINNMVKIFIPASLLVNGKELIRLLLDKGFSLLPNKEDYKILNDYLISAANSAPNVTLVEKCGWLSKQTREKEKLPYVYVSGDKVYSNNNKKLPIRYLCKDSNYSSNFEVQGTLEEWVENVGKYAKYSPLLVLIICAGLGALIMQPCHIENYMIHLYGESSKGKTTIELVGQSLFRLAQRISLSSWDITKAGLLDKCAAFSDSLLILDEITKSIETPSGLQRMVYNAINGSGSITSYSYAKSVSRIDTSWNISIFSSGEKSLSELMTEAKVKPLKGLDVRCFDISANISEKYFTFTSIPDEFESSVELVKKLEENVQKYYGSPADTFLKLFLKKPEEIVKNITNYIPKFCKKINLPDNGIQSRIATRFAFFERVGLYAIEFGILKITKKQLKSNIRQLCREVLNQHKTDEELEKEGITIFEDALENKNWYKVNRIGQKISEKNSDIFGYVVTREKSKNRHFIALTRNNFNSMFSNRQADVMLDFFKRYDVISNKQVNLTGIDERKRYYCLNIEKLKKLELYS